MEKVLIATELTVLSFEPVAAKLCLHTSRRPFGPIKNYGIIVA